MYKWLFVSISCVCLMTDVHSLDEVLTQFTELFENVRNSHQLSSQEIQQAELLINEGRSYLRNPDVFFILPSFDNWVERLDNMAGDFQQLPPPVSQPVPSRISESSALSPRAPLPSVLSIPEPSAPSSPRAPLPSVLSIPESSAPSSPRASVSPVLSIPESSAPSSPRAPVFNNIQEESDDDEYEYDYNIPSDSESSVPSSPRAPVFNNIQEESDDDEYDDNIPSDSESSAPSSPRAPVFQPASVSNISPENNIDEFVFQDLEDFFNENQRVVNSRNDQLINEKTGYIVKGWQLYYARAINGRTNLAKQYNSIHFNIWNSRNANFRRFPAITAFLDKTRPEKAVLQEMIYANTIGGLVCVDGLWKSYWRNRSITGSLNISSKDFRYYSGFWPNLKDSFVNGNAAISIYYELKAAIVSDMTSIITYFDSIYDERMYGACNYSIRGLFDMCVMSDDNERNWPLTTLPRGLLDVACIRLLNGYNHQSPLAPYLALDRTALESFNLGSEEQEQIAAALYRFYSYSFIHNQPIYVGASRTAFQDLLEHRFTSIDTIDFCRYKTLTDNSAYSIEFLPLSDNWKEIRDNVSTKENVFDAQEMFKDILMRLLGYQFVASRYDHRGKLFLRNQIVINQIVILNEDDPNSREMYAYFSATDYLFRCKEGEDLDRYFRLNSKRRCRDAADVEKMINVFKPLVTASSQSRVAYDAVPISTDLYNNFKEYVFDGLLAEDSLFPRSYDIALRSMFSYINEDIKFDAIPQGMYFNKPVFCFVASELAKYTQIFAKILEPEDPSRIISTSHHDDEYAGFVKLTDKEEEFVNRFSGLAGTAYQALHHCVNGRLQGIMSLFVSLVSFLDLEHSSLSSKQLTQTLFFVSSWGQALRYINFSESENLGTRIYFENASLFSDAIQGVAGRYAFTSSGGIIRIVVNHRPGMVWYLKAVYPTFFAELEGTEVPASDIAELEGGLCEYARLEGITDPQVHLGRQTYSQLINGPEISISGSNPTLGSVAIPAGLYNTDMNSFDNKVCLKRFRLLAKGIIDLAMAPHHLIPYMFSEHESLIFTILNKYKLENNLSYDIEHMDIAEKKSLFLSICLRNGFFSEQ